MRIQGVSERWFPVENDPDEARIKIKNLSPGEISDIFDAVIVQTAEYKANEKGKLEPVFSQTTDKKTDREMTLIKAIVDWENLFEEDGETPMECNEDNIIRASREITGFNEQVTDMRERLAEDIEKEAVTTEKDLEKN